MKDWFVFLFFALFGCVSKGEISAKRQAAMVLRETAGDKEYYFLEGKIRAYSELLKPNGL